MGTINKNIPHVLETAYNHSNEYYLKKDMHCNI